MTSFELLLCAVAVVNSSASQLFIKAAARGSSSIRSLWLLAVGGTLMLFSMAVAVWVLQTLRLSQLVPFAAGAYVLVPLGGRFFFKEDFKPHFWLGVLVIFIGILLTFV